MKTGNESRLRARIFLGLLVSACVTITEPLPNGATPLSPPAEYQTWWEQVEDCSGITGHLEGVSWYYIPDVSQFTVPGNSDVAGYWQPYHHSITLAGSEISDADLVRHEMLHALLNAKGHPVEYFGEKCGAIVSPPHSDP
jgi:hypothetical protein